MLTARDANGIRIPAVNDDGSRNCEAWCPCCGKAMVSRVGDQRRPHWAHKSAERCDEWWEVESDWHIEWRKRFLVAAKPDVKVEIEDVLEKEGSRHFSDIRIEDRLSIVLRRARMDDAMKAERLAFFGDLIWLVQAKVSEYKRLIRQRGELELQTAVGLNGCHVCVNADKSFFSAWKNARCLVVFDFRLASESDEEKLWVVLPGSGLTRNLVCLDVNGFVERIATTGKLFRKSIVEINAEFEKRRRLASIIANDIIYHLPPVVKPSRRHPSADRPPGYLCREAPERHHRSSTWFEHQEEPTPLPDPPMSASSPEKFIWPEDFDRTVVLGLTVNVVAGWLVANGRILELETESVINGEANATGCCAVHCSTLCSVQELYWAKRRIENEYGVGMRSIVPQDRELKSMAGKLVGIVEYNVEERPSGRVRMSLRNFLKLDNWFSYNQAKECIWRLTPDLQFRFAAIASQDILEGESRGGRPSDTIDTGRSE